MIAIIDYDMGNLRSVQKGFERVGHQALVTSNPADVLAADKVVLPGVGAFADAIAALRERRLAEPVSESIATGKPFLGICLGLQLLFETSYENGEHRGLGILPGNIVRFDLPQDYKVPHMGWNQLSFSRPSPLFNGVGEGEHFYFVHSYYVEPTDRQIVAAEADYGGRFCASVWKENLYACQFHPEKSQHAGLQVLRNFADLG